MRSGLVSKSTQTGKQSANPLTILQKFGGQFIVPKENEGEDNSFLDIKLLENKEIMEYWHIIKDQ